MAANNRISTGIRGLDGIIDMLRLGDNVVWQVQSLEEYKLVVRPFVRQALHDGRKLIYVRFGRRPPLLDEDTAEVTCTLASAGFESFATAVLNLIAMEGRKAFYVFDCLTDLLDFWCSDLLIGNFFRLVCPCLSQAEAIAYFALIRNAHACDSIARIRETTQLLLDIHTRERDIYIHPLKVWERYSPTMFFPHLVRGDEAVSITSSAWAARLFSSVAVNRQSRDHWETALADAQAQLAGSLEDQERARDLLISRILGAEPRMLALCRAYFTLEDILEIARREIGSGFIGGKSAGMLLARKILETEAGELIQRHWETHDSFYIGADVFYTYIVQNGWWTLRMRQKTPEGYFTLAPELKANLMTGVFPPVIRERFLCILEYFGQSPIIVRSSSLLEDNFGNAFAGKYDSVFCVNQGPPELRYKAFEDAVRSVYASAMSEDALAYRMSRGLMDRDEQMALLVQRVSGDHYGERFFPHVAGVGNSSSLYVREQNIDRNAGMLRLVFGLGTRVVDRTPGDYARLVMLDDPARPLPVAPGDEKKFSQQRMDVLNLREGRLTDVAVADVIRTDIRTDKRLFFSPDAETRRRLEESGSAPPRDLFITDFKTLLTETPFPSFARNVLSTLAKVYDYPVDIEFTLNFQPDGPFTFNLLQCRPLQTRGAGKALPMPNPEPESVLFSSRGDFMGGNVRLTIDYVIFVKADEYLNLPQERQYGVARLVGELNQKLKGRNVLLIGPGRWGTSMPMFGVPTHFSELYNMAAICEYACPEKNMAPDLSFGSHFFQDLVESGIFYAALFTENPDVAFRPQIVLEKENLLLTVAEAASSLERTVHLARTAGLRLHADLPSQRLLCCM